jgi:hypothetical protein
MINVKGLSILDAVAKYKHLMEVVSGVWQHQVLMPMRPVELRVRAHI